MMMIRPFLVEELTNNADWPSEHVMTREFGDTRRRLYYYGSILRTRSSYFYQFVINTLLQYRARKEW
jgi:hypothetical protein